jgi:stress-induced morphogen
MLKETLIKRLERDFPDSDIEVFDLTGGGDHWEVKIRSDRFKGLKRIEQHQLVMASFQAELKSGELHALALKTETKD